MWEYPSVQAITWHLGGVPLPPPNVLSASQTGLVVTDERAVEYEQIRESLIAWARDQEDIQGVAVVGSWARSAARMDSDIDVVVLTLTRTSM